MYFQLFHLIFLPLSSQGLAAVTAALFWEPASHSKTLGLENWQLQVSLTGPFPWASSLSQNSFSQLSDFPFSLLFFLASINSSELTCPSAHSLLFPPLADPHLFLSVWLEKHLCLPNGHHLVALLWLWALSSCVHCTAEMHILWSEADAGHGQGTSAGMMAEEELGNVTSCCSLAQKSSTNAAFVSSAGVITLFISTHDVRALWR